MDGLLVGFLTQCDQCAATRALLRHGASARARDNEGNTPMYNACSRQRADLATAVELVLQCEADETAVNNDGETPAQKLRSPPPHSGCLCSPVRDGTSRTASGPGSERKGMASPMLTGDAPLSRFEGRDS